MTKSSVFVVVVAGAFVACFGTSSLEKAKQMAWPVVPHDDLAAAEARYADAACSIAGENLNGRADPAECGPFPCAYGKCVVDKCPADGVCSMGICADGYCVRGSPVGAKACSPLEGALQTADIATREGCTCSPQSIATPRDREICGSFPCSPNGCYVARCKGDGDCNLGMCSSHASSPHGYCVTDDPH